MKQYTTWLERKVSGHADFVDVIGENPAFREVVGVAEKAAISSLPVWIEGESGTGKTLLARIVHGGGDRARKAFVSVNCELLPDHLARGVLFGQEQRVESNQVQFILGKIREAEHGTLLIQEIGALQAELRWQILKMLQSGFYTMEGSTDPIPAHVRVIFSHTTHEKYRAQRDEFRRHLAELFDVHYLAVPSLDRRRDDIARLAGHFLVIHSVSENKYIAGLTDRALEWLTTCEWPGNVGELSHVIWRAVMLAQRDILDVQDIKMAQKQRALYLYSNHAGHAMTGDDGRVKTLKSIEQEAIRFALEQADGCMTRAAKTLGIGRSTLYRKVQEFNLAVNR